MYECLRFLGCKALAAILLGVMVSQLSYANDPCIAGKPLTVSEYDGLLTKLRISNAGNTILTNFYKRYSSKEALKIFWDTVSYSEFKGRKKVCVHLTESLPEIEHVADLAHELTHAARLDRAVLEGRVGSTEEFVRARLGEDGGEADAFAMECQVKFEIIKEWDNLCRPYVVESENQIDRKKVLDDLYSGKLSASLTGEPYPELLSRQFDNKNKKLILKTLDNAERIQ